MIYNAFTLLAPTIASIVTNKTKAAAIGRRFC